MGRTQRWLLAVLAIWVLAPVLLLIVRAAGPSWRYPLLLPVAGEALPLLSSAASGRLASAMSTSLCLALMTGPIGSVLGFAIGRAIAQARPLLRRTAMLAALLPVIAPPIALGVGLQVLVLGLGLGGSLAGVLFAHLIPATGYLALFAVGVFSSFDFSIHDEARTLGASRWQVFSRITFPLLRARLVESVVLGALVSWGQLAITLLIGGGVVRTLPVELLSFIQSGNDQLGALAALLLSLPPVLAIGLLQLGTRRTGVSL